MPRFRQQINVDILVTPEELGVTLAHMDSGAQIHTLNSMAAELASFDDHGGSLQLQAIAKPHVSARPPVLTEQAIGMILMLADMIREE